MIRAGKAALIRNEGNFSHQLFLDTLMKNLLSEEVSNADA